MSFMTYKVFYKDSWNIGCIWMYSTNIKTKIFTSAPAVKLSCFSDWLITPRKWKDIGMAVMKLKSHSLSLILFLFLWQAFVPQLLPFFYWGSWWSLWDWNCSWPHDSRAPERTDLTLGGSGKLVMSKRESVWIWSWSLLLSMNILCRHPQ